MGIFDSLKKYPGSWNVASKTDAKEELGSNLDSLLSCEVVPSEYGISVKFTFKGGYSQYIQVSSEDDTLEVGAVVDVENLVILKLEREGDDSIFRIASK